MSGGILTSTPVARSAPWLHDEAVGARAMLLLQAAIWISMFAVYFASPVLQMSDSQYSMLTAESIIHNHTPDLASYKIKNYDADLPFNTLAGKHPYQLMHTNGRLLYGFPHGTPILSIPFVAAMDLFGISPATFDGQYNLAGEVIVEKLLAAILMASLVVVFFRTGTLMLDWLWGTSIAIGAGLGTSLWSTGSRGMWSNSWEMMLVGLLVYLLLSGEVRRTSVRPLLLATLLSWMFFVRPTAIGPIVCVSLYLLAFRRREFLPFALGAALWLGALAIYSIRIFGTIFPSYYQQLWAGDANWVATGIFGNLFGPSRGLFVYCPALLAVSYLSIRNWRAFKYRPLVVLSLCCSVSVLLVVASHWDWWGGNCYGPRYLADIVPWMVLLAILAIAAIPKAHRNLRNPAIAIGAVLLVVSIIINAHGALSPETLQWNFTQRPLPAAMLDWSHPQFLAGWIDEP